MTPLNRSVIAALGLVDMVRERGEMSLTEMTERSGLSMAACHRLAKTLVECGYLDQMKPFKSYRLGKKGQPHG